MPDDAELIRGIQDGRKECLAILFHKYWKLAYSVGWKVLREDSEADDIVQEVFVSVFRRATDYDPGRGSAAAWIAQFAYWKAQTRRRQLASMRLREIEIECTDISELMSQRAGMNQPERRALVNESLALLNSKQRMTIELVHFEGYTLEEAAAIQGESLANGRNLYYRGMKALRSHLAPKQTKDTNGLRARLGISRSTSA
jgi:RNA polymerase sigma-70 factor (ECF subfamily)